MHGYILYGDSYNYQLISNVIEYKYETVILHWIDALYS